MLTNFQAHRVWRRSLLWVALLVLLLPALCRAVNAQEQTADVQDRTADAQEQTSLPSVEHIFILDTSGSMGSSRPQWGQYGTFNDGFTADYCNFWKELVAPQPGILNGSDPAVLFPCSYYGKREEQRRQCYARASQGLTLQDVAARLQERDAKGQALCPGPDGDGAMGREGLLKGLSEAMTQAKQRQVASVRFYWMLTDNGFDDSSEKLPEDFYNFLSYNGEPSLVQAWFAPLRRLPGGQGDLVLYLAIQADSPDLWKPVWSEVLVDKVLNPRLSNMWPGESFVRRFVDLRGTLAQADDDGVSLLAYPKDFQRCLTPLPADPFGGRDTWCALSQGDSVIAGQKAFKVSVLDNHEAAKSGYENAACVRCQVRPPRGWNICNVNVPAGGQQYKVVSSLSPEEMDTLNTGLRIEFGQAPTIAKGNRRGTKPIVWNIVASDEAKNVIVAHPEGVELEFVLCLPTTIDFNKLDDEQQSGLDKELFSNIAHLDILERFIMRVAPGQNIVTREWTSDKPVRLSLTTTEEDWWDALKQGKGLKPAAQALGNILAQGAAPSSVPARLAEQLNGSDGASYLVAYILAALLLLLALLALAWFLYNRFSKPKGDKPDKKKADDEEDLDSLYEGDNDDE